MPELVESMPKKSLREHLQELAYRIKLSLLWMTVGTVIAFIFREWIMEWLMVPLAPALGADPKLHFSSPIEPFFTYMRLALQAGLFIAFRFSSRIPSAFTTPSMIDSGRAAQPGTQTSTGMTLSIPPMTL
jgi:Sec-independent protein secretion pathway component TatC